MEDWSGSKRVLVGPWRVFLTSLYPPQEKRMREMPEVDKRRTTITAQPKVQSILHTSTSLKTLSTGLMLWHSDALGWFLLVAWRGIGRALP